MKFRGGDKAADADILYLARSPFVCFNRFPYLGFIFFETSGSFTAYRKMQCWLHELSNCSSFATALSLVYTKAAPIAMYEIYVI